MRLSLSLRSRSDQGIGNSRDTLPRPRTLLSPYFCTGSVQERPPIPMRPSTTSTRASHAPGSQPPPQPSAALLARIADKKKEFEAVDALQCASALFLRRLEGLADDCEAMADSGIGTCMCPRRYAYLAGAGAHAARLIIFFPFRPSRLLI